MTSGKPGEFIITKIEPIGAAPKPVKKAEPTAARPDAHKH
jgi:hypothetical protein